MSPSVTFLDSTIPTEDELAGRAAGLALLRHRVTTVQAKTGSLDRPLIAEFAQAQRNYLDAKIRLEQIRKAGLLAEQSPADPLREVLITPDMIVPPVVAKVYRPRIFEGSVAFWTTVILLLTALACFQHSSLSLPY
jgi:hypothetical protein